VRSDGPYMIRDWRRVEKYLKVCMWPYNINYSESGFGLLFCMLFKLINYFKSQLFLCRVVHLICTVGCYSCLELTREIQVEHMISRILIKKTAIYTLFFFLKGLTILVFSLWLTHRRNRRN
jgi:hypothetical protein